MKVEHPYVTVVIQVASIVMQSWLLWPWLKVLWPTWTTTAWRCLRRDLHVSRCAWGSEVTHIHIQRKLNIWDVGCVVFKMLTGQDLIQLPGNFEDFSERSKLLYVLEQTVPLRGQLTNPEKAYLEAFQRWPHTSSEEKVANRSGLFAVEQFKFGLSSYHLSLAHWRPLLCYQHNNNIIHLQKTLFNLSKVQP